MSQTVVDCSPFGPASALSGAGMPSGFSVTSVARESGGTTVAVGGELDLATRDELRRALSAALVRSEPIELDLTGVTFIDATAVQVVVEAAEGAHTRGLALVVRIGPVAERLLTLTGVADRLRLIPPRDDEDAGACA